MYQEKFFRQNILRRLKMSEKINELMEQGYYFLKTERLKDAEENFLKILKTDKKNIAALDNLGYVKYFQNEFEEGLKYCEKSLKLAPKSAYGHKGKGLHLIKLGKLDEGIKYLKKAIKLDPEFMDPYYDLALTLYENDRCKEAKKYIFKAGKICRDKKARQDFYALLQLIEEKMSK